MKSPAHRCTSGSFSERIFVSKLRWRTPVALRHSFQRSRFMKLRNEVKKGFKIREFLSRKSGPHQAPFHTSFGPEFDEPKNKATHRAHAALRSASGRSDLPLMMGTCTVQKSPDGLTNCTMYPWDHDVGAVCL